MCLMGTRLPPEKRAHPPHPIFGPCLLLPKGGWIKMPLGTEENLGPGNVVLDRVAVPPKSGTAPIFQFVSIVAKRLDG